MTKIYDLNGNAVGEAKLPKAFSTDYRPDVIKRAVLALQSSRRQPYGLNPLAGKRSSAHYHGKRKYRYSMMNKELARISRIHGRCGYSLRARIVPQATKGRRAHGPKAEKVWLQKINSKENLLAIKSAIAATAIQELVKSRGHKVSRELPIVLDNAFENTIKSKDVKLVLEKIIPGELERCSEKKVRAGRGKLRGRKYQKKKGPLIVVSGDCRLLKSARNLAGVDVTTISDVNAELLAPGTHAGRLAIFTKAALEKMDETFK